MKKRLLQFLEKIEPSKEKRFIHTLFDGFFTFAFVPNHVTKNGTHVKDGMDLKRLMIFVVLALTMCMLFGTYNVGHQHFVALGEYTGIWEGFHLKLAHGLIKFIPLYAVTMIVGLGIEFYYAAKKGHPIEEGFLVSGALIPLIMPPDLPLWILGLAVVFAVIIGKEAFGGTGMNIFNIALLTRVFIFFAYPTTISGDEVWVSGLTEVVGGAGVDYSWWHTGFFNGIFGAFGWTEFDPSLTVVDGFSGATPLSLAFQGGWDAVTAQYSFEQIFWGNIPGSIGETSKPLIILGGIFLIATGVASWRIMLGTLFGAVVTGLLLNAWGATEFMEVAWYYQLFMGSYFFAIVYMATDPVTATATTRGKWIYGFLIGLVGMVVRVMNPAYPEGWMLAILFMNVFSPLIDHYVVEANMKRRLKRAAAVNA